METEFHKNIEYRIDKFCAAEFNMILTSLILAGSVAAIPLGSDIPIAKRQGCPNIHVFGARETTAAPGYGSSATVVNDILNGYPGSTAEAINYPACGGQASCGGDSYSQSVQAGFAAAASAVNSFNSQCPNSQIVLVGYSQVRHDRPLIFWLCLRLVTG